MAIRCFGEIRASAVIRSAIGSGICVVRSRAATGSARPRSFSIPPAILKAAIHTHEAGSRIASPRASAWANDSASESLATSASPVYATSARHSFAPSST